jgi:hypothetical protein
MHKQFCSVFLLIALLLSINCKTIPIINGTIHTKYTIYHYGNISNKWRALHSPNADLALISKDDDASLMLYSKCKSKTDASLNDLASNLLLGMTEITAINNTNTYVSKREALVKTYSAKIDGIPRKIKILVVKKNECYYEVILASSIDSFNQYENEFDQIVKSFIIES